MALGKLLLSVLLCGATPSLAQTSFDPPGGCLNVIDVSPSKGLGESGAGGISINYLHEAFQSEQFSLGAGIGYNHHRKYQFSALPIFLSTHYFFLDRRFSPFVNLRAGGFVMLNKKNVGTNEKYSLSKEKQGLSLYLSPSIGIKMHLTPDIGISASITDEAYLVKAFHVEKHTYKNQLIHSLGLNIGVFFQIKGW